MVFNLMFKHSPLPTLVCLLVMLTAVALHPRGGETAPGAEPGTHFILLIDDSGDMRRGQRDVLGNVLPEFLFRGSVEGRAADPALPNFQPGRAFSLSSYFTFTPACFSSFTSPATFSSIAFFCSSPL